MRNVVAIGLVVAASTLILGFVYLFAPQTNGPPIGKGKGIVENARAYCGQFNNADCNMQIYKDANYFKPVKCYWNIKTNNCQAGIGYA